MVTKIIGLSIFLFIIIASIWLGSHLLQFIHLPSIGFVIILSSGLAMMKYQKGNGKLSFITNLKKYSIPSGVIGCIIGIIQMCSNYTNPAQLPAGVAVAVLTIFYGLMLYCIIDALVEQEHKTA